jgi:hypothetical protein
VIALKASTMSVPADGIANSGGTNAIATTGGGRGPGQPIARPPLIDELHHGRAHDAEANAAGDEQIEEPIGIDAVAAGQRVASATSA